MENKVNKAKILRGAVKYANDVYEEAWHREYAKIQFMDGVRYVLKQIKI